jgi:hypothetical protein
MVGNLDSRSEGIRSFGLGHYLLKYRYLPGVISGMLDDAMQQDIEGLGLGCRCGSLNTTRRKINNRFSESNQIVSKAGYRILPEAARRRPVLLFCRMNG